MARLCPDCQIPMDQMSFRDVQLDDCPQCGGIWFDDGELKKLRGLCDQLSFHALEDKAVPDRNVVAKESAVKLCPTCEERLTPYRYMYSSDVLLDECDDCFGVWVQDGELEKMANYLESEQQKIEPAQRELMAAVSAEVQMVARSRHNRGKSIVAFWTVIGQSRAGRPL